MRSAPSLVLLPLALVAGCYATSPGEPACPDRTDPRVHYVSEDPAECATIDWDGCGPDQTPIESACGCGCIDAPPRPPTCPAASDARVHYAGTTAAECAAALFACRPDQTPIESACGCGCIDPEPPPPEPPVCAGEMGPEHRYVGHSPEQCAVLDFACAAHETYFANACGCGCVGGPSTCPDPADPAVHYWSDDPTLCARVDRACEPGTEPFVSDCGCGCLGTPSACPSATDPRVDYWSTERGYCATIDRACEPGTEPFEADCGCGCIAPPLYCPSLHDPYVRYVGTPDLCARADWGCAPGNVPFDDPQCGCGCITRPGDECPQPTDFRVRYVAASRDECAVIDYVCPEGSRPFSGDCGCGCITECPPDADCG